MLEVVEEGLGKLNTMLVQVHPEAIEHTERVLGGSWGALARSRGFNPGIEYEEGCALVNRTAFARMWLEVGQKDPGGLKRDKIKTTCEGKKKTETNPEQKEKPSGLASNVRRQVGTLQRIVRTLGQRAPGTALTDGSYGPATARAWAAEAKKRSLDPFIGKISGIMAEVNLTTYNKLNNVAAGLTPAKPSGPTWKPPNTLTAPVGDLQATLAKLGQRAPGTALTDKQYGPTTARAWKAEADKRDLNPYMARVTSSTASVNIDTKAALDQAATQARPPQPPPGPYLPPQPPPGPVILPPDPGPYEPPPITKAGFKLNPIMLAGAGLVALALLAMSKGKG